MNKEDVVIGMSYWLNEMPPKVVWIKRHRGDDPSSPYFVAISVGYSNDFLVHPQKLMVERPYVTDNDFDTYWYWDASSIENMWGWLGENIGSLDTDGITSGKDLKQAVKEAVYREVTGRDWMDRGE